MLASTWHSEALNWSSEEPVGPTVWRELRGSELKWDLDVDPGGRVRNLGGRYRGAQMTNTSQAYLCLAPAPVYSSGPGISLPTSQTYNPIRLVPYPRPAYQGTSLLHFLTPGILSAPEGNEARPSL